MAKVRLIDANALKEKFIKVANSMAKNSFQTYAAAMEEAAKMAERQPTIDAEPVRHGCWRKGAWKTYPDGYVFSECDCGFAIPYNYCPNCGAKMDDAKEKNG